MPQPKAKIAHEVAQYLDKCSRLVGADAAMTFDQHTFCEFSDLNIESPIEQLFYISLKALSQVNVIPHHDVAHRNGENIPFGLNILPQFEIDRYRADFYIAWYGYHAKPLKESRKVIVECDSQAWHERTEKERRYEKRRDRDLLRRGYHVFRFTGKEIMEDPMRVAAEVLAYVTDELQEDFLDTLDNLREE